MKASIVYGLIAVCVAGAIYLGSPYLATRNFFYASDAETLSKYIDYPALRESLKSALKAHAMLRDNTLVGTDSSGAGTLGSALGQTLIFTYVNHMVDAIVTPEALHAYVGDKKMWMSKLVNNSPVPYKSVGYEGLDQFVVKADNGAAFIFQRSGLFTWKLSGVRLAKAA